MIKKLSSTIIAILVAFVSYGQASYGNNALVKNVQNGFVVAEKTMYVNVTINNTMDTLYWSANEYYGGYFPITRIDARGNDTTYRCNPNGYKELAVFKTYNEYPDTFCKLVIRNLDGYLKFLFVK